MHCFPFERTEFLSSPVLTKKSTTATIEFRAALGVACPQRIFMPAEIRPGGIENTWRAYVDTVPSCKDHCRHEAVLHVTKGELGKTLGTVNLGVVGQD